MYLAEKNRIQVWLTNANDAVIFSTILADLGKTDLNLTGRKRLVNVGFCYLLLNTLSMNLCLFYCNNRTLQTTNILNFFLLYSVRICIFYSTNKSASPCLMLLT